MSMREKIAEIIEPHLAVAVSADFIAKEILNALEVEQEWAVAELDEDGKVTCISCQDWQPGSVARSLRSAQSDLNKLRDMGIDVKGDVGLASRIFTPWVVA